MRGKAFRILKIIILILYITTGAILIGESCQNANNSSSHSNGVGGVFASIVNNVRGDQAKKIEPAQAIIENSEEPTIDANTNDFLDIRVKTIPENSTFTSYRYESSNKEILEISPNGRVHFLKEGKAFVKAINNSYPEVFAIKEFNIRDIKAASLETKVLSSEMDIPDPIKDDNDCYTLYNQRSYFIKYKITPEKTTKHNITYKSLTPDILNVTAKGTILPLRISTTPGIIEVCDTVSKLTNRIYINVASPHKGRLESLIGFDLELTEGEEYELNSINAEYINIDSINNLNDYYQMKYNDFHLIEESNLITINDKKIKALAPGSASIKVIDNSSNIFTRINIEIKKAPAPNDFTVNSINNLILNQRHELIIKPDNPLAKIDDIAITASNDSIIVDGNAIIANKLGSATITIRCNDIERSFDIAVIPYKEISYNGELIKIKDYKIELLDKFIQVNNEVDLNSLINIIAIDLNDQQHKIPLDIIYKEMNKNISITNNILVANRPGYADINATLDGFSNRFIRLYSIDSFRLDINSTNITPDTYFKANIIDNKFNNQSYVIKVNSEALAFNINDRLINIKAYNSGDFIMNIIPIVNEFSNDINNEIMNRFKLSINLNSKNIKLDEIILDTMIRNPNKEISHVDYNDLKIHLNDELGIIAKASNEASLTSFIFEADNPNVLSVYNNGYMKPINIGSTIVRIKDVISGKMIEFKLDIINRVDLDRDNPIRLTGPRSSYDKKDNIYKIQNGTSNRIGLALSKNSTYTKCSFKSSDSTILSVGNDGIITPHKKGISTITIELNDNNGNLIRKDVRVEVVRKDAIQDLDSFMHFIRKGIGHFGAFLVFGIFSTLTYLLFFNKKWWGLSIPFNFLQGFGLAYLTEYLQTLTDGRYGCMDDVWLDYRGFISSAIAISLIFLIIILVKHLKKRKEGQH